MDSDSIKRPGNTMNDSEKMLIEQILKNQSEMAKDIKLLLEERAQRKGAIWVIGLLASGIGAIVGKFL